jgi:hypothetical protein
MILTRKNKSTGRKTSPGVSFYTTNLSRIQFIHHEPQMNLPPMETVSFLREVDG